MENSLEEMVELLREIRDGIDKMNDRLEDIDGKLDNVNGIWGLDDLHQSLDTLETNVTGAIETMSTDLTHELKMIEIKID